MARKSAAAKVQPSGARGQKRKAEAAAEPGAGAGAGAAETAQEKPAPTPRAKKRAKAAAASMEDDESAEEAAGAGPAAAGPAAEEDERASGKPDVVRARPDAASIRLMTWNVNGLRAAEKKGFVEYVIKQSPDVLALNETKCTEADVPGLIGKLKAAGYKHVYFNSSKTKKGYAGTALFSKAAPASVRMGIGKPAHDEEGRNITADFGDFFLVCTYVPNSGQTLERLGYRTKSWEPDMLAYIQELQKTKPVVWTGDLNVARTELDLHNPKGSLKTAGYTPEERACFERTMGTGLVDAFRSRYPNVRGYTYWGFRFNHKALDRGWRIDYFLLAPPLARRTLDVWVEGHVRMSDHAPLVMDLARS